MLIAALLGLAAVAAAALAPDAGCDSTFAPAPLADCAITPEEDCAAGRGCCDGRDATAIQRALERAADRAADSGIATVCFRPGAYPCHPDASGYHLRLRGGAQNGNATVEVVGLGEASFDCHGSARAFAVERDPHPASDGAVTFAMRSIVVANGGGDGASHGGCLLAVDVALTLSDVAFSGCRASDSGGAVAALCTDEHQCSRSLRSENVSFVECSAHQGGAVNLMLHAFADAALVVDRAVARRCSAVFGAALNVVAGSIDRSSFAISRLSVADSAATLGCAMHFEGHPDLGAAFEQTDVRWGLSDIDVRNCTAATDPGTGALAGGAHWYQHLGAFTRSAWTARRVRVVGQRDAALPSCGVHLRASRVTRSALRLETAAFASLACRDRGGGMGLVADTLSASSVVVSRASFVFTSSAASGGGVAIAATTGLVNTAVVLGAVACAHTLALQGGCVSVESALNLGAVAAVTNLQCASTRADDRGGCVLLLLDEWRHSQASLHRLAVVDSRGGGLGGGVHVDARDLKASLLELRSLAALRCESAWGAGTAVTVAQARDSAVLVSDSRFVDCVAEILGGGLSLGVATSRATAVTLRAVHFERCRAATFGGGLSVHGSAGAAQSSLVMEHSSFVGTRSYKGGGLAARYPAATAHSVTVRNCSFVESYAQMHGGGAFLELLAANASRARLEASSFERCGADAGGVAMIEGSGTGLGVEMARLLLVDNVNDNPESKDVVVGLRDASRDGSITAELIEGRKAGPEAGRGGFVRFEMTTGIHQSWRWRVAHCSFAGARSSGPGGAVTVMMPPAAGEIENVTVANCTARNGGAIAIDVARPAGFSSSLPLTIAVRGLHAAQCIAGRGGGLAVEVQGSASSVPSSIELAASTFVECTASANAGGGAVFFLQGSTVGAQSHVRVTNTTFRQCSAYLGGGGLFVRSVRAFRHGRLGIDSVRCVDCSAASGGGGGVHLLVLLALESSVVQVGAMDCERCVASRDGGALVLNVAGDCRSSAMRLRGLLFRSATARGDGGGARVVVEAWEDCEVELEGVQAERCAAQGVGGAVAVSVRRVANATGQVSVRSVLANECAADTGAVASVAIGPLVTQPTAKPEWPGVEVRVDNVTARHTAATGAGAVLHIDLASTTWTTEDALRALTTPPLFHVGRATVSGLRVLNATAPGGFGGLLSVTGGRLHLEDVRAARVHAGAGGGLIFARGAPNITACDVRCKDLRSSLGAIAMLADAGAALELQHVDVSLDGGTSGLVSAQGLAAFRAQEVSALCPVGTTLSARIPERAPAVFAVRFCDISPWYPPAMFECTHSSGASVRWGRVLTTSVAMPMTRLESACARCPPGSYSLTAPRIVATNASAGPLVDTRASECLPCPVGASCAGGADVAALPGRWGALQLGSDRLLLAAFVPLVHGYGCTTPQECSAGGYASCRALRTGFACGRCLPGYASVLGSPGCRAAHACYAEQQDWLLYVAAVALVVGLSLLLGRPRVAQSPATPSPSARPPGPSLATFVVSAVHVLQLCALASAQDAPGARQLLRAVGDWAMLQPLAAAGGGGGTPGVCVLPDMTPAGLRAFTIAFALGELALVRVVWLLHSRLWAAGCCWRLPPLKASHSATTALLASLVFANIASAVAQLIAPLHVPSHGARLAIDGTLPWLGTWWQWAALLWFAAAVAPAPLFVLRALSLVDRQAIGAWHAAAYFVAPPLAEAAWQLGARRRADACARRAVFGALARSYRSWQWAAVPTARKLGFVVANLLFAGQPQLRVAATALLALGYLVHHVHAQPHRAPSHNLHESAGLTALVFVVVLNTHRVADPAGAPAFALEVDALEAAAVGAFVLATAGIVLGRLIRRARPRGAQAVELGTPLLRSG